MDGTKRDDFRPTRPRIFETPDDPIHCPVNLFRKFSDKRPLSAMEENSPMYLTPIPQSRLMGPNDPTWYYATPMGVNTLGGLLKNACQEAGIQGKKTNHSLRKTTVAELSEAGIPPHKIIKITGHKNSASIQHYDTEMSMREHKSISNKLMMRPRSSLPASSHTIPKPPSPKTIPIPLDTNNTTINNNNQTSRSSTTTEQFSLTQTNQNINVKSPFSSGMFENAVFNNCTFNFHNNNNNDK